MNLHFKRLTKLRIASGSPRRHALKRFKFAGGLVILALEGVDDRNAAEALRNAELEALGTELPPLQNDEYWLYELRGAEAQNTAGDVLGEVVRVVSNSMQLLLELKTPRGIQLVPFVDAFIVEFRRDANILVLEPPEGLPHEPATLPSRYHHTHTRYLADYCPRPQAWWAGLLEMALSNMVSRIYEIMEKGCIDRLMTHRLVAAQVC